MTDEVWVPALSWTHYSVSSHGRIRRETGGRGARAGHIMAQRINPDGYACVTLYDRGKKKGFLVNRLVCAAFHGAPPSPGSQYHAAHIDGDRANNRPENLRWATKAENEADKLRHGTVRRGEQTNLAKLTEPQVVAIRQDDRTLLKIATDYGVSESLVSQIKRRKIWAHV